MAQGATTHVALLEQLVLSGAIWPRLLVACALGGAVGLEREWRHKDSGLRTNMLICMGAALFTIMSEVLAGTSTPNKGQVAANIVQGVGFLGAGLILHTRNQVLGLTSAATVFCVAAVGMTCGAGMYMGALIATVLLLVSLSLIGILEVVIGWKRYPMLYEVRAQVGSSLAAEAAAPDRAATLAQAIEAARLRMLSAILKAMDAVGQRLQIVERDNIAGLERISFSLVATRRMHEQRAPGAARQRCHRPGRLLLQRGGRVSTVPFVKAHACGNDFLVIEDRAAVRRHGDLAAKLCERHTGIGADGVEFLKRRPDGNFFLRLFNADGHEAELSGNGTRCVAAWLAQSEGLEHMTFGTHGGTRTCRILGRSGDVWSIESGMGIPRLMRRSIQIAGVAEPIDGVMVNVGNPHFVLFVDTADFSTHGLTWQQLGAKISTDPLFQFGTNVEFVRILAPGHIEFRIFERGVGPTHSSGTGTCASSAAAIALRDAARDLTATSIGGPQQVSWPSNDAQMMLTGPAEVICRGEVEFA